MPWHPTLKEWRTIPNALTGLRLCAVPGIVAAWQHGSADVWSIKNTFCQFFVMQIHKEKRKNRSTLIMMMGCSILFSARRTGLQMFIGEPPAFPDLSRDFLMQWDGSGIGQILLWQRVFSEQQPSRTGLWRASAPHCLRICPHRATILVTNRCHFHFG